MQVTPQEAYLLASFASKAALKPTVEGLIVGAKSPDLLFDLGGGLFTYLFDFFDPIGGAACRVWIPSEKASGTPILATELRESRFPSLFETAASLGIAFAPSQASNVKVDQYFCVYAYPKIGVAVRSINFNFGTYLLDVYDIFSGKLIDGGIELDEALIDGCVKRNATTDIVSSFRANHWFDAGRIDRNEVENDALCKQSISLWTQISSALIPASFSLDAGPQVTTGEVTEVVLSNQYGTDDGKFQLIPQIDETHCALASAEMIFDYLLGAEKYSQSQLEPPFAYRSGVGTSLESQVNGYKSLLADNQLDLKVIDDYDPTFNDVKYSIDSGLPIRSSVPGHARCCAGYRIRIVKTPGGQDIPINDLLIFDPYPPNTGAIRWEASLSSELLNFIKFEQE